uniref:Dispersed gene family protein 1 (DGF-1) n=1 Tax=Heterorhabditis bacteriophora TaxID=37862 RepID=A0A1I7X538_HETBA
MAFSARDNVVIVSQGFIIGSLLDGRRVEIDGSEVVGDGCGRLYGLYRDEVRSTGTVCEEVP